MPRRRAAAAPVPFAEHARLRVAQLLGREPRPGNRVTLLRNGPATHRAQLDAIASARHHVHLETYILTDDELGCRYEEVLCERSRAGVQVRVMIDGHGSLGAGDDYRRRLREAGVELREFNSVNPFKNPRVWRMTRRTHRKTLVVDGRIAFTGGINITDEYRRDPADPEPATPQGRGWRDTHVQIEGPAVREFQEVFLAYWARLGGLADQSGCYPDNPRHGDALVSAVTDQGADFLSHLLADQQPAPLHQMRPKYKVVPRIYHAYLDAMRLAHERIWITQAYFAPNGRFVRVLAGAARRGVDVRLLLPGTVDAPLLKYAGRARYTYLMKAGVQIYEYQGTVLHAKTATVDGYWSTVGSANLDYRSFFHNDEANALILCRDFAAQMERMYQDDLAHARRMTLERWKQRGLLERLLERFAAAIKFLL